METALIIEFLHTIESEKKMLQRRTSGRAHSMVNPRDMSLLNRPEYHPLSMDKKKSKCGNFLFFLKQKQNITQIFCDMWLSL